MTKNSIHLRAVACSLTVIGAMLIGSQAYAAERELDAHQHGHGYLNIAIEGSTLWIELETPGADIVGFEHPARSDEDKAAIADAMTRLGDPIGLFGIPADASCTLVEASVEPVGYGLDADDDHHDEDEHAEDDHDEHDDEHAEEAHDDHDEHAEEMHDDHDEHEDEKESHAEFHAEYRLQCDDPAAITSLTLTYFDVFSGAEELEVSLITDDGQSRQEVTPAEPVVNLGGN
ncbi:MAG: DUF2796 domain-containing protein [Rhodospirillales bacterium]|nr:DUF2796 domain-containing protein [Rhodospirillales bacterium]